QNKWLAAYEGDTKNLKVTAVGNNKPIASRIQKVPGKDSIFIFTPLDKYDSLQFKFKTANYEKIHSVNQRTLKLVDTLQVKFAKSGTIQVRDTISFTTNTPFKNISNDLIQIIGKDSRQIPFTIKTDALNNTVKILFDKVEEEK